VASGEEGHHLVDEVFFGKAAGFKGDREDVDVNTLFFIVKLLLFLVDELTADLFDSIRCGFNIFIPLDWQGAEKPPGQEQA